VPGDPHVPDSSPVPPDPGQQTRTVAVTSAPVPATVVVSSQSTPAGPPLSQMNPIVAAKLRSVLPSLVFAEQGNEGVTVAPTAPTLAPGAGTNTVGASTVTAAPGSDVAETSAAAAARAAATTAPPAQAAAVGGNQSPVLAPVEQPQTARTQEEMLIDILLSSDAQQDPNTLKRQMLGILLAERRAPAPYLAAVVNGTRQEAPEVRHVQAPLHASHSTAMQAPVLPVSMAAPGLHVPEVTVPTQVQPVAIPVAAPQQIVAPAPSRVAHVTAQSAQHALVPQAVAPIVPVVPQQYAAPLVPAPQQPAATVPLSMQQLAMAAPTVPAAHRVHFKLPNPEKFSGRVGGSIMDIEVWGEDVRLFAKSMGIPIKSALGMLTTGAARTHVSNMCKTPQIKDLTDDKFLDQFITHFTGHTKPRPVAARDKLFRGEVQQQPGQSVVEFEGIFNQVALDAHPIQELDLMFWFREGLLPEIREGCTKPTSGQREFSSLAEIVTHAMLQEDYLKETNRNLKVPKVAAMQSIHSSYHNTNRRFARTTQGDKGKRPANSEWQQVAAHKKARNEDNTDVPTLPYTVVDEATDRKMEKARRECVREGRCTNCQQKGCRIKDCSEPRSKLGKWMDARLKKIMEYQSKKGLKK
jgi:hypothetical protein